MHGQSAVIDDQQARLPVVQTSHLGKCYGRPQKTAKIQKAAVGEHPGPESTIA